MKQNTIQQGQACGMQTLRSSNWLGSTSVGKKLQA